MGKDRRKKDLRSTSMILVVMIMMAMHLITVTAGSVRTTKKSRMKITRSRRSSENLASELMKNAGSDISLASSKRVSVLASSTFWTILRRKASLSFLST